jgi:CHAT domain-containing protein
VLPHITWCTTGPLAFLPLHAAGIYNPDDALGAPKALDFVVSSYTPSLSALLAPSAHSDLSSVDNGSSRIPKILIVSQPDTPGHNPLPSTSAEATDIARHFPNDTVTHLASAHGTVEAVLDAMEQNDWVHLACHGVQDESGDPTKSAFFLHDGRLELAQLMGKSLPCAELAVLSACQTAKGDEMLPEEAVHLAAGMLAVGYRSVVATMWSIADEDGPILADGLYAALTRNLDERRAGEGLGVAYALHEAVERLREKVGEKNFARWVPFVHYGL